MEHLARHYTRYCAVAAPLETGRTWRSNFSWIKRLRDATFILERIDERCPRRR